MQLKMKSRCCQLGYLEKGSMDRKRLRSTDPVSDNLGMAFHLMCAHKLELCDTIYLIDAKMNVHGI